MSLKRPNILASALFIAIVCTYVALAFKVPLAYIWATYEDLFGEWIQFWCFVVTAVLSVRMVFIRCRYRLFFAILGLACFYVAMEEISWGQRVVGFGSPEFFKEHNLQGETNLHNLLTGPYRTMIKDALSYGLSAAMVIYGLVYPLALRRKLRLAAWLDRMGIAAPPLNLAPYFITAGILELGPFSFNEAEVAELLIGFAVVFLSVHYVYTQRRQMDGAVSSSWPDGAAAGLAGRLGLVTILVLNFSALTTLAVYATSSGRKKIDNRISNGVEKLAGRYARHGLLETAIRLYERILAEKPGSRSTRRKLAECLRESGDQERFNEVLQEALELDLAKYKKDPDAASVNRSLVRTYRMLGDAEKANEYLENALRIGLGRIEDHPTSSNAAYSLARTY